MPRSYRKNILRTFKSTRSRFVAIFAIVALGVGFLAGLSATPVDMKTSVERYMDDANFYDIRVVSTLGLTDGDVTALQEVPGVEAVQPAYSADLLVQANADVVVARAHSLPPQTDTALNQLQLVDGRLPQAPGECVVEAGANAMNPSHPIGTVLTVTADNEDLETKLAQTEFTVVGIVHNSNYFSFEREPASVGNGTVSLIFYLQPEAFAYEAYTELYLTAAGAKQQDSLEDDYQATVDAVTARIEEIQDARCQARYEELRGDAQAEIDDAWAEYNDAKAEAEQELADAAAELADGRRQLADGEQEILDGEQELTDGQTELAENEAKVTDGMAQLADAQAELADGERQWQQGYNTLLESEAQLAEAKQKLEDGQREYDEGLAAYNAGRDQLAAGESELAAALQTLNDGQAEYDAGSAQWQAGVEQLEQGQAQLDQLRQLNQGEKDYTQGEESYTQGVQQLADQLTAAGIAVDADQAAEFIAWLAARPGDPPATTAELLALAEEYLGHGITLPETVTPEQAQAVQQGAQQLLDELNQAATEEQKEQLKPITDLLQQVIDAPPEQVQQALQRVLDELNGIQLDPAQQEQIRQAVQDLLAQIAQQNPDLQPQLDALLGGISQLVTARRQLDDAKAQLDAGIQAIVNSGAAADEAAARALFSDENLDALQKTIDESQAQLDAAKAQLDEAAAQLESGWAQYTEGLATLEAGKAELAANAPKLEAARQELEDGWAQYYEGLAACRDGQKTLTETRQTLTEGWATLTDKQLELADAQRQIADARKTLADARQTLADARQTLAEKTQELRDGEIEYADAEAEVAQKLADARAEIEDGEAQLAELEAPEWYVWDRSQNVSYASFTANVNKLQAITTIFPIFFFLVAALVVSSTMSRMVEEERLQIGTLKALGYTQGQIAQKYLWYALGASLSGTVVGLAVGFIAFPTIIWNAYTMMYYVPTLYTPWLPDKALFAGGALVGLSVAVTLLTCRSALAETPAALLLPRAPKAGKRILLERITPLWRRMPFTYKVTARNLLRYKRRFWMTVIGVAGCTALLVTGFGISDSLNAIIENQYSRVYHYQLMTVVTDSAATESGPVYDYLFDTDAENAIFSESLAVRMEHVDQTAADGSTVDVYLMIPAEVSEFADYVDLHQRISGEPTPLGEEGVILTEKLATLMNAQAGDTVTLKNSDGTAAQFTVAGVCEHYVYNYAYLSPAAYQAAYGTAPANNAVLSRLPDDSQPVRDEVSAVLLAQSTVASVTFTQDSMTMVLNMLNSIDAVVVLIIVCAACLAFVVLYNLSNINIAERVKEIATIKVLGFYQREVDAYVNRESVALTLIGTALGLVLGIWLHRFIIVTVEVDAVMFGRDIAPLSFLYAALLTLLFSTLVNLFMARALRKISMVESMKAPE